MKITGYRLQHTLRELAHTRDIAAGQFDDSLKVFPGEMKARPQDIMTAYLDAEGKIARLQTGQALYNLKVQVDVLGKRMTLSEAVKLVGGAGRAEKMWRSVAAPKKDRYSYERDTRDATAVVATATVTTAEAATLAKEAARWASALREAIQTGNATEIEMELDPALFE